jgi:hypothetical protein
MNVSVEGSGFPVLLTIAFIVLKLCNVITWSWWWVTAPLWIPVAALAALAAFSGILAVLWLIAKVIRK